MHSKSSPGLSLQFLLVGLRTRAFVEIKEEVLVISTERVFYEPDGLYGKFAGGVASRSMVKQSSELDMLSPINKPLDKLENLITADNENMSSWIEHFTNDYLVSGKLTEDAD
ncbi:hypothetical protein M0805_009057 [Coniferiporia weirii]|nr:hypothetical protein M0805_009057 [Coniferiporia weirii]